MIVAVVPAFTPVTLPDVLDATVAFPLLLLHVPPPASVNAVTAPAHTVKLPLIAAAAETTEAVVVYCALHPDPVPSVTVTVYTPVAEVVAPGTVAVAVAVVVIATGPVHA